MVAKLQIEHREYVGCLRVHTAYGEGTEKLPSIVKAANQAGLDFLVVADTNSVHYLKAGMEGWSDRTAVLVGQEIVGPGGHCLALGIRDDVSEHAEDPAACLAAIARQGGAGVVCHPHDPKQGLAPGHGSGWTEDESWPISGVEIWPFLHDWRSGLSAWNRRRRTKTPTRHLKGPTAEVLALWDRLLRRRPTAALTALDAHGLRRRPKSDLTAFSYLDLFSTVRMHLLIPPFSRRFFEDKRVILDALRRGQGFVANDALAPATGFRFEVRRGDGALIPMGEEAVFEPPMTLRARLPREAKVRLITDGQAWFTNTLRNFDLELSGAGVIRLEAELDGRPWIFSNPIYLKPATPEMIGPAEGKPDS